MPILWQKRMAKRSRLTNDFFKDRNNVSKSAYRKQCKLCVTLSQKAKIKQYSSNLDPKFINDNKRKLEITLL